MQAIALRRNRGIDTGVRREDVQNRKKAERRKRVIKS
jgi:hypothetical protein